jgi:5-methylcytosine-specific restriction enzyme B
MPDAALLNTANLQGLPLGPWLECINRSVRQKVGRDARNLQIGHSYLLDGERPLAEFSRFVQVLRDEIIPLLEDYCYEDYAALGDILGTGLVDTVNQAIRSELFEDSNRADLVQALMQAYPEMATSRQAVASEAAAPPEDDDETDMTAAGAK